MAAAGGAGPAAAGVRRVSETIRQLMAMEETGNYGEPNIPGMPWWQVQLEPNQRMPTSEHLTSSGYSSNRARFPTGKARKEHYTRKAILEAKKEAKRREHYAAHRLGSAVIAEREAERKTRKQRVRNIRRALKAKTRKSRSRQ